MRYGNGSDIRMLIFRYGDTVNAFMSHPRLSSQNTLRVCQISC